MEPEIEKLLAKYKITIDPLKDQFFLVNEAVLAKIIKAAAIKPNERVLEIGPGLGTITRELAKKAKEVVAVEIDPQFRPTLSALPRNVKVIYGNALELKVKFNKLVASLPYSLCEPLMHRLTGYHFKLVLLIFPKKFAEKIISHPFFSAFFNLKIIMDIPKSSFYPRPKTSSVLVKITPLADPVKVADVSVFIRRYIYKHPKALLKNSLREAIIKASLKFYGKKLTKNEAREIINQPDQLRAYKVSLKSLGY